MTYRMAECLVASGLLILAIFGWVQSSDLPTDARMFPAALLTVIGALSLWMLVRGVIGKAIPLIEDKALNWEFAISSKRMLIGFATLGIYFLALPYVGFFTSSFILVIGMAKGAGYHKPVPLILSAAGFCAFVYIIFVALFERPLPKEFFMTLLSSFS